MVADRIAVADDIFRPLGDDAAAALYDDTETWRDRRNYTLSQRIWGARQATRDGIDRVLREAIATGESPIAAARKLEQYLSPSWAPKRNERGRLEANQPKRIVTRTPSAGGGSYPARRLARTEITRAFGKATEQANDLNPFVLGTTWNLSGRHKGSDECDRNAARDVGLGRGAYPKGQLPRYPNHPHELCWLGSKTVEDTDAIVAQLRRDLGLDRGRAPTPFPGSAALTPFRRESDPAALLGGLFRLFRALGEAA